MVTFHVDLYSTDPKLETKKTEFTAIVTANDEEGAIREAKTKLKETMPKLVPPKSWAWSVYEIPLG